MAHCLSVGIFLGIAVQVSSIPRSFGLRRSLLIPHTKAERHSSEPNLKTSIYAFTLWSGSAERFASFTLLMAISLEILILSGFAM